MKKVTIIGAGQVGAHVASAAISKNLPIEIFLVDQDEKMEGGQVLDLLDSVQFSPRTRIRGANYHDTPVHDSDVFVITAGAAQKPGETRIDLLGRNLKILESIKDSLGQIKSSAVVILVTNPVDILTQHAEKIFGLPRGQVFGSGTILDTSRLRWRLARTLERNVANVHGYVLGEHGDTSFVPWSTVSQADKFSAGNRKKIETEVQQGAYQIIEGKGATYFGIGAAVAELIDAVISDSHRVYPVSAALHGEYGVQEIAAGVPCQISERGVHKIVEINLEPDELSQLQKCAAGLHDIYQQALDARK